MTLTLREGRPFSDRVLVDAGEFQCRECPFRRYYATKRGALEGASLHLKHAHGVRLVLPEFVRPKDKVQ